MRGPPPLPSHPPPTNPLQIFPLLDTNHDNYIDLHELATWHAENGRKSAFRRNEREFNRTDTNKDGKVCWGTKLGGQG